MNIEVICTGDEVLSGKTVNSNFAYIAQKLEEAGWPPRRGVTIGDNREELREAFLESARRADVVIVNGGLGPTVDDLSTEAAAAAAGAALELNEPWLKRMEEYFSSRGRKMAANNRKQAMLPAGAEVLDNPIGTACGFGLAIGRATFYFTPGVPRELFRMMEEQIMPRLLERGGESGVILLRRFHSFGLGESQVDDLLGGLEEMAPKGSAKLGFRAHYPQLESKLTIRAAGIEEARAILEPLEQELRGRLGNYILAVDEQTLEGVVIEALAAAGATLAVVEDFTGGQVAARLSRPPQAEQVLKRATAAPSPNELAAAFDAGGATGEAGEEPGRALAGEFAEKARLAAGATHGMAALGRVEEGSTPALLQATIWVAIATAAGVLSRQSSLLGNREWIRLGAVELVLDSLRRFLQGLPLDEQGGPQRPAADNN